MASLLSSRRVVLCVGCGGVGKTTTSAALALAAARQGKRVLCLTIDPARRLAQSLGLEWASTEARVVEPSLLARVGVPAEGTLTIMRVDTKTTFDSLVNQLAPDAERRDRILNNVLYRYISTSLAGTQEYMAMEKLYELRGDARYDLIILDTPPTANALDFLDAPERLVGAIDSPAIRWFVQALESSGRLSFNLVAKSTAVLLKGLSRVTGSGFLEQVAGFIKEINAVFGGWRQRADAVAAALRGPDVAYVLVTTPDPLAIREVIFFAERLRSERMRPDAFVVNRVNPKFTPDDDRVATELAAAGFANDPELVDKCKEALRDAAKNGRMDRIHLMSLEPTIEDFGVGMVAIPTFASDVYDLEALSEISTMLLGEQLPAGASLAP
ncbi:MAG: ArsA family ATPase [Polyangiaceae bacterium]|nr:ArsA family ATPase [Polyangiaceae bacterium]